MIVVVLVVVCWWWWCGSGGVGDREVAAVACNPMFMTEMERQMQNEMGEYN